MRAFNPVQEVEVEHWAGEAAALTSASLEEGSLAHQSAAEEVVAVSKHVDKPFLMVAEAC